MDNNNHHFFFLIKNIIIHLDITCALFLLRYLKYFKYKTLHAEFAFTIC